MEEAMPPKKKQLNLVGYVRVSQVAERDQDDSLRSPDQQRDAIKAYVKAHGHTVTFLEPDLDESGKSLDRPRFREALDLVRTKQADGVIAAKLDRLTRRVGDLGKLLDLAEKEKWNLIAVDLGLDASTANGKLVWNILASVAEWELDVRRTSWNVSVAGAIEDGKHIGPLPIGYQRRDEVEPQYHPVSGELIRDGRLVVDAKVAPVILAAFRMRASGGSWLEIADFLTESDVLPNPRKNKKTGKLVQSRRWSRTGVKGMLSNRVYRGEVRNGAYANENAHEAIVDEETFEAATKSRFYNPRTGSIAAQGFLTTLVRCSGCGHRLSVTGTSSKREDGQRRASYFCRGHHAVGDECDARAVAQVNVVDAHVETVLVRALRSGDPRVASFTKIGELMALAIATYTDAKANLDAILSAPASTREKLGDRYWTEVEKKQAATEAAQVGFSEALRMSETIAWKTITKPDGTHDQVEAAPEDLAAELTSGETPVVRRREIARALIDKVVVAKADPKRRRWQPIEERVEVVFRKAASDLEEAVA
jgi:DNA invertase Pin-like site-specific DNA recombinase